MVHFLTAENYQWSQRDIPVLDIQLSSKLSQLDSLPDLSLDNLYLSDIKERLHEDSAEREHQKTLSEAHFRNDQQENYPLLVVEKDHHPMVMDGNGQALRALLLGKTTISAWYCETNNELPRNYWYPIDDMMRLVKLYTSSKDQDPTIKETIRATLLAIFAQSDVARIAYEERIVNIGTSGAKELLED